MSVDPILNQPRSGSACLGCGSRIGLYVVQGAYHSLCAPCTRDRIEINEPQPSERPSWVAILYAEVQREVRRKEYQERMQYTVSWDLVKCGGCGAMMKLSEARYRIAGVDEVIGGPTMALLPARQLPDGTLSMSPTTSTPRVHRPLCPVCYRGDDPSG